MAVPPHTPQGDPPLKVDVMGKEKGTNWLAWLLLLAGLAALLWWLLDRDNDVVPVADATNNQVVATADPLNDGNIMGGDVAGVADSTGVTDPNNVSDSIERPLSQVPAYMTGTDPTPATFTFERLNFPTDSANILPGDEAEVQAMAAALKERSTVRIRVTAYADPRGPKAYNQKLAQDRADSVKQALVAAGIGAERIEATGGGELLPNGAASVEQARAEARRASVTILSR